jgi:hypothetical protein
MDTPLSGCFYKYRAALCLLLFALAGCGASYATPGGAAPLEALGVTPDARRGLTNSTIQSALDKQPPARFPTAVAVARVQAPGYRSMTSEGWGGGKYSLVTTRDAESEESIARLAKLPMVTGIAPVNRLLLPANLNSDLELRQAAAALQADLLLVYTFDTVFFEDTFLEPLSLISLGFAPNHTVKLTSTASAVLMDTRNGFIYGVAEATDKGDGLSSAWGSDRAVDRVRRDTEADAFGKLVDQLEVMWADVLKRNASAPALPGVHQGVNSGISSSSQRPIGEVYRTQGE